MHKLHVGHHLLRVRIRKVIFNQLKEAAQAESHRTGLHITVSDLVRQACVNYLLLFQAQQRLIAALEGEEQAEEAIIQALMEMGELDEDESDEDSDDEDEGYAEPNFRFYEASLN
jgi:hypothetical protein